MVEVEALKAKHPVVQFSGPRADAVIICMYKGTRYLMSTGSVAVCVCFFLFLFFFFFVFPFFVTVWRRGDEDAVNEPNGTADGKRLK